MGVAFTLLAWVGLASLSQNIYWSFLAKLLLHKMKTSLPFIDVVLFFLHSYFSSSSVSCVCLSEECLSLPGELILRFAKRIFINHNHFISAVVLGKATILLRYHQEILHPKILFVSACTKMSEISKQGRALSRRQCGSSLMWKYLGFSWEKLSSTEKSKHASWMWPWLGLRCWDEDPKSKSKILGEE